MIAHESLTPGKQILTGVRRNTHPVLEGSVASELTPENSKLTNSGTAVRPIVLLGRAPSSPTSGDFGRQESQDSLWKTRSHYTPCVLLISFDRLFVLIAVVAFVSNLV